jgi:hypothetical protein
MRKFWVIAMLLLVIACNKDDDPEKFSSIDGYWIVRTPDDATEVTFRIGKDSDGLFIVDRVAVRHNGIAYDSKAIEARITLISDKQVESITMVNNSFVPPFFVIRYQDILVNDDFTEMQINISSFNVDGNFREFSPIIATRD